MLQLLKAESEIQMIRYVAEEKLCHCYLHTDQVTQSLQHCREALEIHKDPSVLCDRAEAYIASDMFDEGLLSLLSSIYLIYFKNISEFYVATYFNLYHR